MFKKIKQKDILKEPIKVNIEKNNKTELSKIEINDYIDQFIYYRKLRGYTQDDVGKVIGVSGKYYYKYENRIHQLNDFNKIRKIADFLEIQEELKKVAK